MRQSFVCYHGEKKILYPFYCLKLSTRPMHITVSVSSALLSNMTGQQTVTTHSRGELWPASSVFLRTMEPVQHLMLSHVGSAATQYLHLR